MNVYVADPAEWVALFKMPDAGPPGLWRIVFPDRRARRRGDPLGRRTSSARCRASSRARAPYEVRYKSVYRVHQRVCKTFRSGRVLLAGDAAHVNNPLGAFGLNSGIHDAISVAEKLGRVWRGEADDALLDLYVRQRRMAAVEQVERMSIRNKRQLEERDPSVQRQRLQELIAIAKDPVRAREPPAGNLDDHRPAAEQRRCAERRCPRLAVFDDGRQRVDTASLPATSATPQA